MKKKIQKKKTVKKDKPMSISIVLDETGSMSSRKKITIDAFNEYIKSLKSIKNNISVSLTKFNSSNTSVIYCDKPLKEVPLLDDKTYLPKDLTPLYDAVGITVNALKDIKGKTQLVVIITDGEENASKEYDRKKIFDLIEEKKKLGWTFVFMGADQDAWEAGQKLGMSQGNVMSFASANIGKAMGQTARSTVMYARSASRTKAGGVSNFFSATPKKKK